MIIAMLTFTEDTASVTQRNAWLKHTKETEFIFDSHIVLEVIVDSSNKLLLFTTDNKSIYYEHIDSEIEKQTGIKPDLLIFLSKHQSAAGVNSLSCHTQGNWAKAEYGGTDNVVAPCPAGLMNAVFLGMKGKGLQGYDVIMEVTHHGPDVSTPSLWVEIGSNEESWNREDAGETLTSVLLDVLPHFSFINPDKPVILGIGGLHHAPSFSKRTDTFYVGHVCPKYMLSSVSKDALRSALFNTIPKVTHIVYDWKGMAEKERIVPIVDELAEEFGLEVKRTKEF